MAEPEGPEAEAGVGPDPSNWKVHTARNPLRADDFVLGVEGDGPTCGSRNPGGGWAKLFLEAHAGEPVRGWRRDRDGDGPGRVVGS